MTRLLLVSLFIVAASLAAYAQHQCHGGHQPSVPAGASPYAGFQTRAIKALSERESDDLRVGRGTGLALCM